MIPTKQNGIVNFIGPHYSGKSYLAYMIANTKIHRLDGSILEFAISEKYKLGGEPRPDYAIRGENISHVTQEQFKEMGGRGEFIVTYNYQLEDPTKLYGIAKNSILQSISEGKYVITITNLDGALKLSETSKSLGIPIINILVYTTPEDLKERAKQRVEDETQKSIRLQYLPIELYSYLHNAKKADSIVDIMLHNPNPPLFIEEGIVSGEVLHQLEYLGKRCASALSAGVTRDTHSEPIDYMVGETFEGRSFAEVSAEIRKGHAVPFVFKKELLEAYAEEINLPVKRIKKTLPEYGIAALDNCWGRKVILVNRGGESQYLSEKQYTTDLVVRALGIPRKINTGVFDYPISIFGYAMSDRHTIDDIGLFGAFDRLEPQDKDAEPREYAMGSLNQRGHNIDDTVKPISERMRMLNADIILERMRTLGPG